MKKKLFLAAGTLAVGVAAFIGSQTLGSNRMSSTQLSDIEALTDCEVTDANGNLLFFCRTSEAICFEEQVGNLFVGCKGNKEEK